MQKEGHLEVKWQRPRRRSRECWCVLDAEHLRLFTRDTHRLLESLDLTAVEVKEGDRPVWFDLWCGLRWVRLGAKTPADRAEWVERIEAGVRATLAKLESSDGRVSRSVALMRQNEEASGASKALDQANQLFGRLSALRVLLEGKLGDASVTDLLSKHLDAADELSRHLRSMVHTLVDGGEQVEGTSIANSSSNEVVGKISSLDKLSEPGARELSPNRVSVNLFTGLETPLSSLCGLSAGVWRLLHSSPVFSRYPVISNSTKAQASLPGTLLAGHLTANQMIAYFIGMVAPPTRLPLCIYEPESALHRHTGWTRRALLLEGASSPAERVVGAVAMFTLHVVDLLQAGGLALEPVLGETYGVAADRGRLLAEHVSCSPPRTIYHFEAPEWSASGEWTHSIEWRWAGCHICMGHRCLIQFTKSEERLWVDVPDVVISASFFGGAYFALSGPITVESTSGAKGEVWVRAQGAGTSGRCGISGEVKDAEGKKTLILQGDATRLTAVDAAGKSILSAWRENEPPKSEEAEQKSLCLRALRELPATDSRLRPDIWALRNGDFVLAQEEWLRLQVTKEVFAQKQTLGSCLYRPLWLQPKVGERLCFRRLRDYWQCSETGVWPGDLPDIFLP